MAFFASLTVTERRMKALVEARVRDETGPPSSSKKTSQITASIHQRPSQLNTTGHAKPQRIS